MPWDEGKVAGWAVDACWHGGGGARNLPSLRRPTEEGMPSRPASTLVLPALLLPALAAACGRRGATARRSRLGDTSWWRTRCPRRRHLVLREVGRIGRTDGPWSTSSATSTPSPWGRRVNLRAGPGGRDPALCRRRALPGAGGPGRWGARRGEVCPGPLGIDGRRRRGLRPGEPKGRDPPGEAPWSLHMPTVTPTTGRTRWPSTRTAACGWPFPSLPTQGGVPTLGPCSRASRKRAPW